MIIPMKKAYVYGLSQDGDRLIQRMMQLGCVQVDLESHLPLLATQCLES